MMKLSKVIEIIQGKVNNNAHCFDCEVSGACGADLMSDVLVSIQPDAVLLTGLCNLQVIRTAQMADVRAIIFVRGKVPQPEMVDLADTEGIPLVTTPFGMFEVCGRLYSAGLPSFERNGG
jgi:predicted transcriptional regulator